MQRPGKLTAIAILQIVSGMCQFPISCLATASLVTLYTVVCGLLTSLIGGVGACAGLFGYLSFLLVPIGLLEIISGILLLANVRVPILVKITAAAEIFGLFLGGIPGAVVGVITLFLGSDPDAKRWFVNEAPPAS